MEFDGFSKALFVYSRSFWTSKTHLITLMELDDCSLQLFFFWEGTLGEGAEVNLNIPPPGYANGIWWLYFAFVKKRNTYDITSTWYDYGGAP